MVEKRILQLQTKKDLNEKIRIPSKEWNVFVTQRTIDDIWGNLLASTQNRKKRSHGDYTRAKKNYGVFPYSRGGYVYRNVYYTLHGKERTIF